MREVFLCVQPPPVYPPAIQGSRLTGIPLSDSHLPSRIQFWCLPGLRCGFLPGVTPTTADCRLFYQGGQAKKPRAAVVGPRRGTQPTSSVIEICLNYNRGRCFKDDYPRRHACLLTGCGGPTKHRRSPRSLQPQAPPSLCTPTIALPHAHLLLLNPTLSHRLTPAYSPHA